MSGGGRGGYLRFSCSLSLVWNCSAIHSGHWSSEAMTTICALTLLVTLTIAVVGTTHSLVPRQIEVVHNARTVTIIVTRGRSRPRDDRECDGRGSRGGGGGRGVGVRARRTADDTTPVTSRTPVVHICTTLGGCQNNCSEESDP